MLPFSLPNRCFWGLPHDFFPSGLPHIAISNPTPVFVSTGFPFEQADMSDTKEAAIVDETSVDPRSVDAAWKYLTDHHATSHVETLDLKALRRRIDWHIDPLAFLCYVMQFIDKVLINVKGFCYYVVSDVVDLPRSMPQSWV